MYLYLNKKYLFFKFFTLLATEVSITFEEKDIFLDHFKKMLQNGDITHYLALDDAIKDARDFAYGYIARQDKMIDIHIDVGDELVLLIISVIDI
jgi:hypothetical protein